jgi:diacylglycerol kinase
MKKHTISFKHAWDGLVLAFETQPNLTVHVFSGLVTSGLAYLLGFSVEEWLILVFTISLVFIAEMVNTTIEAVCDVVCDCWHIKVKKAKDVGAGMVLLSAFVSVIIGLILFVPKIINLFN